MARKISELKTTQEQARFQELIREYFLQRLDDAKGEVEQAEDRMERVRGGLEKEEELQMEAKVVVGNMLSEIDKLFDKAKKCNENTKKLKDENEVEKNKLKTLDGEIADAMKEKDRESKAYFIFR